LYRALEAACAAYASLNLSLLHYITSPAQQAAAMLSVELFERRLGMFNTKSKTTRISPMPTTHKSAGSTVPSFNTTCFSLPFSPTNSLVVVWKRNWTPFSASSYTAPKTITTVWLSLQRRNIRLHINCFQ